MYEIDKKLEKLEMAGTPIGVALIGVGQMGSEIIAQVGLMKGMRILIAADINAGAAEEAFRAAGYTDVAVTDNAREADTAMAEGKPVVTGDYRLAISRGGVQVVIDATGSPEMGARSTLECIRHKKHITMMNVECDVTAGPVLRDLSRQAGIVYSLTAGDEPGSIIELYRFARAIGFDVVAAGKGKNNPLDIHANPGTLAEKAAMRKMSARMLCEFVDGSKTSIEMAAVSNATGLLPDISNMHGPKVNISALTSVFALEKDGGILRRRGAVDYGIGDINPGVFVIFTTESKKLKDSLVQRDMGEGPYYLLLRPYHLCGCETPLTAAQAVIYGESSGHPGRKLRSECTAIAKKDLNAGETLDGIGGYCYRAGIERYEDALKLRALPAGLAEGAVLTKDVPKDGIITRDDIRFEGESVLRSMRKVQDELYS
ncbi:MAG: SAF domain-containing protein [Treponema sp.]|jgi:predicted homoserine dehydrogenase-like protein|nr:SAF domain-containing protein [Treponema sp.]